MSGVNKGTGVGIRGSRVAETGRVTRGSMRRAWVVTARNLGFVLQLREKKAFRRGMMGGGLVSQFLLRLCCPLVTSSNPIALNF